MRCYFRLFVLIVVLFLAITPPLAGEDSSTQTSVETLIKEYTTATEELDLERIISLYGDGAIWEDPGYGEDGDYFTRISDIRLMYGWLFSLPNVQLDVTDSFISADGHQATVEWLWSGINGNDEYAIRGVSVLEIEENKIVHEVIYYDPTTAP